MTQAKEILKNSKARPLSCIVNDLVLKFFENNFHTKHLAMDWIQQPKLSLIANFLIPRVCDFDFMTRMNLRIH